MWLYSFSSIEQTPPLTDTWLSERVECSRDMTRDFLPKYLKLSAAIQSAFLAMQEMISLCSATCMVYMESVRMMGLCHWSRATHPQGQCFKGVANVLNQSCWLQPDVYASLVFVGLHFCWNLADNRVDKERLLNCKVDKVCCWVVAFGKWLFLRKPHILSFPS